MLVLVQELEGEEVLQLASIELHGGGPVEGLQGDAILEAGLDEVAFEGLLIAALDLVG